MKYLNHFLFQILDRTHISAIVLNLISPHIYSVPQGLRESTVLTYQGQTEPFSCT